MSDLPKTGLDRIRWAITPAESEELRRRYDAWSRSYDADLTEEEAYRAPAEAARVAARYLPHEASLLDAACGTGLSGQAMAAHGFNDIAGLDFSTGMLAVAREKGVYSELIHADLAEPLALDDDSFQAVTVVGESLHLPVQSYREFARIVSPSGYILYCGSEKAAAERGLDDVCQALAAEGRLTHVETGKPFQPLPRSEPDLTFRVILHRVTR